MYVSEGLPDLPANSLQAARSGARFARRSGASFRQRMPSRGRGTGGLSVLAEEGRLGVRPSSTHARSHTRVSKRVKKQALLPSVTSSKQGERALEEGQLGGDYKMAVPTAGTQESIITISDEEDDGQEGQISLDFGVGLPVRPLSTKDSRLMKFIPRLVSPMLHKVQEWEVQNQTIFKADKQVEFMDSSGVVMRGTICGEASGKCKAGMAQVRLDFWQPGSGASQSGCDGTHALGGLEEQFLTRRLGRPACIKTLVVRVGALSGHRLEERVRPGAARTTSGDASSPGFGIQEVYPVVEEEPSTSQGVAFFEVREDIEEDFLDYVDDEEAQEVDRGHRRSVQKGCKLDVLNETTNKVVRSDRRVGGDRQMFDAGNLHRVPRGTVASGFSDPVAVLSGANQNRCPDDRGVCKPLFNAARERTGETRATRETGATEKTEEAAARETAAAPEGTTVTIPGAVDRGQALQDVGRTVWIPAGPADTELRPATVDFLPLQQPKGQEAENPRTSRALGIAWPWQV
ncbi:hypothetical protein NDU88_002676 [Pleurodeles waltl]|uniref:Uncharacterized protein n=1 Tax=Pleurodeles waltl TaxID=8319 RepID=A0AAV7RB07_PLEWA|nr:hypothetical protein NDU88_002676 [Pleurodeles waltl]